MKGKLFSTHDGLVDFRTEEFLLTCPEFWPLNASHIDEVWWFDTENESRMKDILTQFRNRTFKSDNVEEVCARMGFDLIAFKSRNKDERQPLFQYNNR